MKAIVFSTREAAEAAQQALDAAAGVPRRHTEGTGPHDYRIDALGAAADRIRERGVRTDHVADVIARADGGAHALVVPDDPRAEELEADDWFPLRDGGSP